MKQSLQLRLGQHLTMTPQLQQAIRLLQLSTMELQTEIQQALESNPMLEANEDGEQDGVDEQAGGDNGEVTVVDSDRETSVEMQSEGMPEELPMDSNWEDTYDISSNYSSPSSGEALPDIESRNSEEETLQDHLVWQAQLTPFSETDFAIATSIIDSIDDDGYLKTSIEDILEQMKDEFEIELDEVEAVLHRVQAFDPVGVGARDLQECLTIQLRQLDATIPWYKEARRLIEDHFALLAGRDYNQLMRRMKLSDEQLQEVVRLVHTLTPRPGSLVASGQAEYIVPDVFVRKTNGIWQIYLNGDAIPKLNINTFYAGMIQRADKSADNTYMQGQLQEARWLIKSLNSRNETLLKVATCIVARQKDFLEQGEEAMKALVLHDVAEEVGMHESTISRITNKKYMHTPRGIFELKYFFSSHVSTASGGECSSTAIRALIKKLVASEDARKPLSDSKIAKVLADQGINVARRTVAKYRDALAIPPSNERKRIA
ncbi:MAG: RNA polymerase factor sigma-54 [Gammaproteobacteria bacterium]|nr:RNA polymerase factor sigma-54 [Gammaproteobacteria bacterium]